MRRKRDLKRGRKLQQSKSKKDLKRTPLKRTPFKRGARSSLTSVPTAFAHPHARFRKNIIAPGVCAICGCGPKATDGLKKRREAFRLDPHHVVPQRYLRRHVSAMRLRDAAAEEAMLIKLLFDERNGMCLCRGCHAGHEDAARRITRGEIPASAVEFAVELQMEHVIERFYPVSA